MESHSSADYPLDTYVNKRAVARRHRATLFGFLATVAALPLLFAAAIANIRLGTPDWVHRAAWLLLLAAHTYTILQGTRLKFALGENAFFSVLFACCMAIPIVNLIALISVNFELIALLRRAGLRIGFLGVSDKDYDRCFSPWLCPWCDYDLTGNCSGICPECGNRIPAMMLPILEKRESEIAVDMKTGLTRPAPTAGGLRDTA